MSGIQFLFNADFDFALRNDSVSPQIQTAVESMAPLFAVALNSDDTILSNTKVSDEFYEYLKSLGISHGRCVNSSDAKLGEPCDAWGWNESAVKSIDSIHGQIIAPSPQICRLVNSREFAHTVNSANGFGVPRSHVVNTVCELEKSLESERFDSAVLKPFFGNSGAGFLFLSRDSSEIDWQKATQLVGTEPAILEPWLPRISDIASLFRIDTDGVVDLIGHHRNICNNSGSFYGTMICSDDPEIVRWEKEIESMILVVAKALFSEGYFGLVSIDSFSYWDNQEEKIALAVDINCRYTMSYVAHQLKQKSCAPALFYRFIARKRHSLPESYECFIENLGDISYNPCEKRGVFITSPLRITGRDGVTRQPLRSAFCVVGNSADDLLLQDDHLRQRILRAKKK